MTVKQALIGLTLTTSAALALTVCLFVAPNAAFAPERSGAASASYHGTRAKLRFALVIWAAQSVIATPFLLALLRADHEQAGRDVQAKAEQREPSRPGEGSVELTMAKYVTRQPDSSGPNGPGKVPENF